MASILQIYARRGKSTNLNLQLGQSQGRRELGNIGGGGCTGFLTNFWRNFDQLSEDLILTNQCHFKAIFSGEGKEGRGGGGSVKANTMETRKYETSMFS